MDAEVSGPEKAEGVRVRTPSQELKERSEQ